MLFLLLDHFRHRIGVKELIHLRKDRKGFILMIGSNVLHEIHLFALGGFEYHGLAFVSGNPCRDDAMLHIARTEPGEMTLHPCKDFIFRPFYGTLYAEVALTATCPFIHSYFPFFPFLFLHLTLYQFSCELLTLHRRTRSVNTAPFLHNPSCPMDAL